MSKRSIFVTVTFLLVAAGLPAFAAAALDLDRELPKQVTFSKDVAPLMQEKCGSCHRPGDIAPMAFTSYDDVRPWAKSIRRVVAEGTMPPWHADPEHGDFSNDRSLSDFEKALIHKWVKQGAPLGDAAAMAPLAPIQSGWRLGKPDLEVTFAEVSLDAGGPDIFEDLPMAYKLEEDRWIEKVEVLPGDRRVVHHVIVYVLEEGQDSPSGWLGAWAAGMDPMTFPEGTGRLIKKGSTLIADMHYHPTDEPTKDQTRLGLHFYDEQPSKELVNLWVQNPNFKIPAGDANHEVRSSFTFSQDATVHALLPHMHYRGKDFTYTARFPDGREQVLLQVNDYDFNWQTVYKLAEPLDMPKGSKINCVAHFDNSTGNADNPDPTKDITFGNESFDEMMIGFVDYTVKDGIRPMNAAEKVAQHLAELVGEHPGSAFDVTVRQGDAVLRTALYLPEEGAGLWYVPVNGTVYEGRVTDLEWTGDKFTAKLVAPFGSFSFEGTTADAPSIRGSILTGDDDGDMAFEGEVAGTV